MQSPNGSSGKVWARLKHIFTNREIIIVVGFSALGVLLGLVGNRLMTQVIDPKPLGELYLMMNLAQWLSVPATTSYVYVTRHWSVAQSAGRTRWLSRMMASGVAIQAMVAAVAAVMLKLLHFGISTWLVASLVFAVSVTQAVVTTFEPIQTMDRRRVSAGVLSVLGPPLRPFALMLAGPILLRWSTDGLLVVQAMYSCALAAAVLVAFALVLRNTKPDVPSAIDPDGLSLKGYLIFVAPFLVSTMATQGATSAERWGLERRVDLPTIALFVQAIGLATAITGAATTFLNIYFSPLVAAAAKGPTPLKSAAAPIRNFLLANAVILGATWLVTAMAAPVMTTLLFGPKFAGVRDILPWTTLGAVFFAMGQALTIYSFASRATFTTTVARVISLGAYIIALLTITSSRPAIAFAKMYVLGNLLYVLLMSAVAWHLLNKEGRWSRVAAA